MKYGKLPFIFRSRFVAQLHVAVGILLLLGALSFAVTGVLVAKHIEVYDVGFAMFLVVGALGLFLGFGNMRGQRETGA